MFQIKICGITSAEDAAAVAAAGADAIGLNFYQASPRCVSMAQAEEIGRAVPESVAKVGLFVNHEPQWVNDCFDRVGLDMIQLHGDEPPESLPEFGGRPLIRALRCPQDSTDILTAYLDSCRQIGVLPQALLVDALVPGQYGGTGKLASWDLLSGARNWLDGIPLILAGGLTPENVADGIDQVRPQAVDTASGVESEPGKKDVAKIEAFVSTARRAFKRI